MAELGFTINPEEAANDFYVSKPLLPPGWTDLIIVDEKDKPTKGGIARIELEARTADYKGEDYKGEEWIERHDPFNLIIKWRRSSYANLKLPTIKDFNMKLCRTGVGNGVINALKDERDNNKLEDLIIKYHRGT